MATIPNFFLRRCKTQLRTTFLKISYVWNQLEQRKYFFMPNCHFGPLFTGWYLAERPVNAVTVRSDQPAPTSKSNPPTPLSLYLWCCVHLTTRRVTKLYKGGWVCCRFCRVLFQITAAPEASSFRTVRTLDCPRTHEKSGPNLVPDKATSVCEIRFVGFLVSRTFSS